MSCCADRSSGVGSYTVHFGATDTDVDADVAAPVVEEECMATPPKVEAKGFARRIAFNCAKDVAAVIVGAGAGAGAAVAVWVVVVAVAMFE